MDLRTQQRTAVLLMRMSGKRDKPIECIPYSPKKISYSIPENSSGMFERATPESQGIDSALLNEFISEMCSEKDLFLHSLMVLRHSKVIAELNVFPYEKGMWHVSHSMAKSIVGIGIGILIDKGLLSVDMPIVDFFPNDANKVTALLKKDITIRHLLTMTSGVNLNEAGSVTEKNWVRAFLNSGVSFKPGTKFMYNSMNTYMLSAIVQKITGKTLFEFLKEHMFEPMGIKKIQWESCPMGISKGGWGIYILPEDIAKIAQLIINKGVWNKKRIVSEEWIEQISSLQTKTDGNMSDYGYGYQIWMGKRSGSCQFNGMFGQNAYIFPDLDMVIVATAGNADLAPKSRMTRIVESYFGDGFRPCDTLKENRAALRSLKNTIKNIENPPIMLTGTLPDMCYTLDGISYKTSNKYGLLMPLVIQGLQNNHSPGITQIGFEIKNETFYLKVQEDKTTYSIPVGFGEYIKTELDFKGEPYIIKTFGVFTTDEDDNTVLKIDMPFIETANVRKIKIFFIGDKIKIAFSETPGLEAASDGISAVMSTNSKSLLNSIMNKANEIEPDYFEYKVQKTLSPTVYASKCE
ncbi:MAG: serine hydrolase [Christensenellaceae bacterium]|nr:serine hydrolase [Christensenellaceae bacterium]